MIGIFFHPSTISQEFDESSFLAALSNLTSIPFQMPLFGKRYHRRPADAILFLSSLSVLDEEIGFKSVFVFLMVLAENVLKVEIGLAKLSAEVLCL